MANWQWTQWQGASYLICESLQAWSHGFFTRGFWPQTPEQLTSILDADAAVHRIQQVHGNRVLSPQQMLQASDDKPGRPEADALISDGAQQALWVCSADCSPILIGDQATGRAAAIHAGWRGTAAKIVPFTVDKLVAQGSRLRHLVVAIGPAIAGEVYQVSTQVAVAVGQTIHRQVGDSEEALIEGIFSLENSPLQPDPEPGRLRLDVRRVNALQLEQLGVSPEQISLAPHCTFQDPQRFFSYRRTQEKKVQWSGIVSH